MDLAAYRNSLGQLRKSNPRLHWQPCRLHPLYDPLNELAGWKLLWVGTFEDANFVRFKEHWDGTDPDFARRFFSYHYGPYRPGWDLEKVQCKAVAVRLDGIDYYGRGYHIHDGTKDGRIFQDQLKSPLLSNVDIPGFLKAVGELRLGHSIVDAFVLEFL